jgi:hypothetical protein
VTMSLAQEQRRPDAGREQRRQPEPNGGREPDEATPPARAADHEFHGTSTSDLLRQIAIRGRMAADHSAVSLEGSVALVDISPELRALFPREWVAQCEAFGTLRAQSGAQFRVQYDRGSRPEWRFEILGEVVQGQLAHPRLPHPLSDIRAAVRVTEQGLWVRRCSARCGTAAVSLQFRREGFAADSPLEMHAEIQELELDQALADVLPDSLQTAWRRFQPGGTISGSASLSFDGTRWRPELSVQCLGTTFSYDKFPYRLEHCRGRLVLKDDVLRATELKAYSAEQPVLLSLELHDPFGASHGWIEANGEIPLDEKLLAALPEQGRRVVRALQPRGTISFEARVERRSPDDAWRRRAAIRCNRCSIRYEPFPYPIYDLCGVIDLVDDRWTVRELQGTNDSGRITCRGSLDATENGPQLSLRFTGEAVLLEAELRDALPANMRQVWNDFHPTGDCDLEVAVDYLAATSALDVTVVARPRTDTASITPAYFPCRLGRLQGALTYRGGRVTLEKFRGELGGAHVAAEGHCEFSSDGSWRFQLNPVSVDRLRFDRELVTALPAPLRKAIVALNPVGAVDLNGWLTLSRKGPDAPLTSQWNVGVGFQQASIDCGVKLDSMHGVVTLAGEFDGERFGSRGELSIDSLVHKDLQFTRIGGPIWIDETRVLFGSWVDRPPPGSAAAATAATQTPRQIVAKLFDGTVLADGWISLADGPRYVLQAKLHQASVARCAQEMIPGRQDLQGTLFADIELHGSGRSLNNLRGNGKIQLRNADVYETPLMVSVLKNLSARRPDKSNFSSADVDFSIQGNHIYFRDVKFNADAMNLAGDGEMNFQSEIRLTLHAAVGRNEMNLPVLRDLVGGASKQIMQIHVGGTLSNPEVRKEAFPALSQAIQQLQAERDVNSNPMGNQQRRLPRK